VEVESGSDNQFGLGHINPDQHPPCSRERMSPSARPCKIRARPKDRPPQPLWLMRPTIRDAALANARCSPPSSWRPDQNVCKLWKELDTRRPLDVRDQETLN